MVVPGMVPGTSTSTGTGTCWYGMVPGTVPSFLPAAAGPELCQRMNPEHMICSGDR